MSLQHCTRCNDKLCRNFEEVRDHNYVLTATVLLAMTDDDEDQDEYSDGYI